MFQSVYTDPKTRERETDTDVVGSPIASGRASGIERLDESGRRRPVARKKRLGEIGRGHFVGPVAELTTLDEVLQDALVDMS